MQRKLSSVQIKSFRKTVLDFYTKEGRHTLPWRATTDPYKIAVSEIMLQQTQVPRVIEKYKAFLKAFPTAKALAKAPLSVVLSLWSGLGYNRRAKFMQEMAKSIVVIHKGVFPRTATALETLPGIGHYTARAICAFAYNQPVPFIETNIRTVFIHHFFADAAHVSDTELLPLIEATLDQKHPARWYAALMDYGTALKQQGITVHRKSAQYVRQSTFQGSTRQLRGAIIKTLIHAPQTKIEIMKKTERNTKEVSMVLTALQEEKLIEKIGTRFALANH